MAYEFGDIIDTRNAPTPLGHFIIIVGETKNEELLFYTVTSRVYRSLQVIIDFFNDCIDRNYRRFFYSFRKEVHRVSDGTRITLKGPLAETLFLDYIKHYSSLLTSDSMVVINRNPEKLDKDVLVALRRDGKASTGGRLCASDVCRLATLLKTSQYIGLSESLLIRQSFNSLIKDRKGGSGEIKCT